jgi:hypothetical protein
MKYLISYKDIILENTELPRSFFNDLMESRKEYYRPIDNTTWTKYVSNRIEVTDLFQKIDNMIIRKLDSKLINYVKIKKSQNDYRIIVSGDIFKPRFKGIDFGIDIIDDEWFLIHLNGGDGGYIFFICDQFEGLEKFIEDIPIVFDYTMSIGGYN